MKHIIIAIASAAALGLSTPVFASADGSCHFHGNKPAAEATVVSCAVQRKDVLATSGKIDAAWKAVKQEKIEQVEGKKGKEWKVTFKDPAARDKTKQTLYMFFTVPGNFIAANFTGQ